MKYLINAVIGGASWGFSCWLVQPSTDAQVWALAGALFCMFAAGAIITIVALHE